MKKGVAVPYIIAIILGVVVVGLIGYWLFRGGGTLGGKLTATECNQKLIVYCSEWQGISNFGSTKPESTAENNWSNIWIACAASLGTPVGGPLKEKCQQVLGIVPPAP